MEKVIQVLDPLGLLIGGGVLVSFVGMSFACCFGIVAADRSVEREVLVSVSGHHWERVVAVEERAMGTASGWCRDLPADARIIDSRSKDRTVAGESQKQSWCTYEALEWKRTGEVKHAGEWLSSVRTWPTVASDGCEQLGCTRPGDRRETLTLELSQVDGSETYTCTVTEGVWTSHPEGARTKLSVGGLFGTISCNNLEDPSVAPEAPVAAAPK